MWFIYRLRMFRRYQLQASIGSSDTQRESCKIPPTPVSPCFLHPWGLHRRGRTRNRSKLNSTRRNVQHTAALDACPRKQFFAGVLQRRSSHVRIDLYAYISYIVASGSGGDTDAPACEGTIRSKTAGIIKTRWIGLAPRDAIGRRSWPTLTPKISPNSGKRCRRPSYPATRGDSPFTCTTAIIYFVYTAYRAAVARSLARSPPVRSLVRPRRLQSRVTALPPIELDGSSGVDGDRRPGTKRQRPTSGTRTRPRGIPYVFDSPTQRCRHHRRRAGQFASSAVMCEMWTPINQIQPPRGRPSYPRVLSANVVTNIVWSRAAPCDERSSI